MNQFLDFLKSHSHLKTKFILAFIFLALLPTKNYYNSLQLDSYFPLVKPVDYQVASLSSYPVNYTNTPAPYLSARGALVIDVKTKTILFDKNPDLKLLPASTTKIMTGLIVLENYDLNDVVLIESVNGTGQKMRLEMGERITVENLLYGLLVQSGNDAATALAQYYPQGQDAFIDLMNQKAKDLGLNHTQFTNSAGLDAYGHYTTVHDLGLLSAEAIKNRLFKKVVSTQAITVSDVDNTITHELETINDLLGNVPGLAGIKTGWTDLAGECLVTYTKRGNQEIITVILGSQDRFKESQTLIEWAFANHQWLETLPTTRS